MISRLLQIGWLPMPIGAGTDMTGRVNRAPTQQTKGTTGRTYLEGLFRQALGLRARGPNPKSRWAFEIRLVHLGIVGLNHKFTSDGILAQGHLAYL